MKTCSKCLIEKKESEFFKMGGQRNGLRRECKLCTYARKKKYPKQKLTKAQKKARYEAHKRWRKKDLNGAKQKAEIMKKKYRSTWQGKFVHWKAGAKARGIMWDLELEYLKSLPLICFYTGEELVLEINQSNTISIDRIDNSKDYTKDNIVFCTWSVNMMKNNLNRQDFINICGKIWNNDLTKP